MSTRLRSKPMWRIIRKSKISSQSFSSTAQCFYFHLFIIFPAGKEKQYCVRMPQEGRYLCQFCPELLGPDTSTLHLVATRKLSEGIYILSDGDSSYLCEEEAEDCAMNLHSTFTSLPIILPMPDSWLRILNVSWEEIKKPMIPDTKQEGKPSNGQ